MSNKLEGFVKDNKKEFEVKGPSAQLWERISAELDKKPQQKKTIKLYQWMSIAAVFVVGIGLFFNYGLEHQKEDSFEQFGGNIADKKVQFVNMIEEKKDSLQVYKKDNPELYKKFTGDMAKLNS